MSKPEIANNPVKSTPVSEPKDAISSAIAHVHKPTPENKAALTGQIQQFVGNAVNKLKSSAASPSAASTSSASPSIPAAREEPKPEKKPKKPGEEEDNKDQSSKYHTHWLFDLKKLKEFAQTLRNPNGGAPQDEAKEKSAVNNEQPLPSNAHPSSQASSQDTSSLKNQQASQNTETAETVLATAPTPTPTPGNSLQSDQDKEQDHYSRLQIDPNARQEEIADASARAVFKGVVHDNPNQVETAMSAAETLLDPSSREAYNARLQQNQTNVDEANNTAPKLG